MEMEKEEGLGLEITELRLGLPGGTSSGPSMDNNKKRVFSEIFFMTTNDENNSEKDQNNKTQIVGWPPVNSYRMKKNNSVSAAHDHTETGKLYVKVSMDGAPFLRKIDLKTHTGYSDLALAFQHLFTCHGIEYIPIYEDKDGDWMLVGDVPWELFTESCRRLRIMKRSDAKGFGLQFKQADRETLADDDEDLKL